MGQIGLDCAYNIKDTIKGAKKFSRVARKPIPKDISMYHGGDVLQNSRMIFNPYLSMFDKHRPESLVEYSEDDMKLSDTNRSDNGWSII